jgi:hypothetical protein
VGRCKSAKYLQECDVILVVLPKIEGGGGTETISDTECIFFIGIAAKRIQDEYRICGLYTSSFKGIVSQEGPKNLNCSF